MTKADLVERVTAQISRTAGPMISKKDCARVVDAFLESIKEALQAQKNIEVRGFVGKHFIYFFLTSEKLDHGCHLA